MATRPQKRSTIRDCLPRKPKSYAKSAPAFRKLARVTMPLGIELGNQLAHGKNILGYGNFGGWCETLGLSCRMPELYMSIAHFAAEHGRDAVEGLSVCGILTERIRGLQNDVQ
jgi:hypothetical protein